MAHDFGEYLVDIRERLAHPLPIRVVQWRVFLAIFLETFCVGYLSLLSRNYRSCLRERYGLNDPHLDLNEVRNAFLVLDGHSGSREQLIQAHEEFFTQLQRRMERSNVEVTRRIDASRAGLFLGTLLYAIAIITMTMCCVTGHMVVFAVVIIAFVAIEYLASLICMKGWHRS